MSISVGDIVEGKVTGITKFGAFVECEDGTKGLVHISQISNDYIEKVEDVLKVNDAFDDLLSKFMKESNERLDSIRQRENKKFSKKRKYN